MQGVLSYLNLFFRLRLQSIVLTLSTIVLNIIQHMQLGCRPFGVCKNRGVDASKPVTEGRNRDNWNRQSTWCLPATIGNQNKWGERTQARCLWSHRQTHSAHIHSNSHIRPPRHRPYSPNGAQSCTTDTRARVAIVWSFMCARVFVGGMWKSVALYMQIEAITSTATIGHRMRPHSASGIQKHTQFVRKPRVSVCALSACLFMKRSRSHACAWCAYVWSCIGQVCGQFAKTNWYILRISSSVHSTVFDARVRGLVKVRNAFYDSMNTMYLAQSLYHPIPLWCCTSAPAIFVLCACFSANIVCRGNSRTA